jgi:ABC-type uncharacterized transport system permease subunit
MKLSFERRDTASRLTTLVAPLIALALTVLTSLVLFAALGKPAGQALYSLLLEPFVGWYNFSELLLKMGPLMLIAQGLAIGFRANVFNIGAEGQLIIGAICASALPVYFPEGTSVWMLPAMIGLGAIGGAVWAGLAAGLRTRFNANEILVTLMLTLIATQVSAARPVERPARLQLSAKRHVSRCGAAARLAAGNPGQYLGSGGADRQRSGLCDDAPPVFGLSVAGRRPVPARRALCRVQ